MKMTDLKPSDYQLYVDLDGVLADLHTEIERVLDIKITMSGGDTDWDNADEIWRRLQELGEPDFSKLKKLPDADKLWNYVIKHNPSVLTATGRPAEENAQEKVVWVKTNLTGYKDIHTVVASRLKAQFATPESILIDDRMKSIGPWRQAGGIGILHTSADETIKELKKLGL